MKIVIGPLLALLDAKATRLIDLAEKTRSANPR